MMMKGTVVSCTSLVALSWSVSGQAGEVLPIGPDVILDYSLDIGSDLDLADPITAANNIADAGDIYLEPAGPSGGPIKNDDDGGPTGGYPLAGAFSGFETGMLAQQPTFPVPPLAPPFSVGGAGVLGGLPTPSDVRSVYNNAFDIDEQFR